MTDDRADEARSDDDDEARQVPRSWTDPAAAPPLLRAAALIAAAMWAIGFVSSMWLQLSQIGGMGPFSGQEGSSRLLGAVATSFTATWGYLLVAVVAFTAATIVSAPGNQANSPT
jgi:hypothetical protein